MTSDSEKFVKTIDHEAELRWTYEWSPPAYNKKATVYYIYCPCLSRRSFVSRYPKIAWKYMETDIKKEMLEKLKS